MFLILTQLSFLLLTASGWGWWLHWFLFRKVTLSARGLLLCFGAGFCLQLVPLTNLMYLDFPIRKTFWIPAVVGVAGLAHCWMHRREVPRFCPRDKRELKWAAGIFAAVFVLQGVSLFHDGPFDYYGTAFQDHVSYVSLAQWMVDRPYSILSAGTEPWLLKAIILKGHRPGQSVAQAYLAAGTFGDAKEVFGTLSTFFMAIFGVMTYLLARSLSMSRSASATAALWAALSLGATKIHLFAFLSQASTLFAFPALILSVRMPGRELWRRMTLPAIFLSYVFICYTEFFPFAALILVALLLTIPAQPFRVRAFIAAGALFIGVLLVPPYLPHVGTFMLRQLGIAAAPNVNLDGFSPFAGTIYGWAGDLLAVPALASPTDFRAITILGYLLLIAVASAYFSISMRRRMWLAALVAAPMLGLFAMGSSAEFSRYAFWKVQLQFEFISIILIVLGIVRVSTALRRGWGRDAGKLAWIACWIPIMLGIYSGAAEHAKVFRNDPRYTGLALLRNAEAHNTFAQMEANPATTYVIAEQSQLGNAWLAYHARKSKAYITAPMLGDMVLHPPGSLLPMVPPGIQNAAVVITSGIQSEAAGRILPSLEIINPQGFDADLVKKWYWMGETMGVRIIRPFTDPPQAPYELTASASPGMGHPTPLRRIEVINTTTGERQEVVIRDTGPIGIPLMLASGANTVQMTLIEPSSGFVTTPQDGRKLLVRLENIRLRYRK